MKSTYYLSFKIVPSEEGLVDRRIESAEAYSWVVVDDPVSAQVKANFHIRNSGWSIVAPGHPPEIVVADDFLNKDWGEKCFNEAQEFGISTFIVASGSAEELFTETPVRQTSKQDFNVHNFLQAQQEIRSQGSCLFYQRLEDCDKVIDAHSIQKNGALSTIARDGLVYSASPKFGDLKKNKGKLGFSKIHIKSMSTFRGLCQHHDNMVFRPIDLAPLQPSEEQAFLYGYRSVLRERFAKECTIQLMDRQLESLKGTAATKEFFQAVRDGNNFGLDGLKHQQSQFDESHKENRFSDIKYVLFESSQPPTTVFSGSFYPDWGFGGEFIQSLRDLSKPLALITFSFAPTSNGWCFLFAWHKVSDVPCRQFIGTLQQAIRKGRHLEDLLFGLVLKCCENTAFCPNWLERKSSKELDVLADAMAHGADLMKLTLGDYLKEGIAGIHEWKFDSVLDNLR